MFQKLAQNDTFIKLAIWGEPGSGKTLFSLHADKVAYLDLENGADRYVSFVDFDAIKIERFDQMEEALAYLAFQEHPYQTLVIDSATEAWGMCMRNMIEPDTKPDWISIKGRWKNFLRSLRALKMDVILIGRAKDSKDENKWWVRTGMKEADLESSTCHDMDFVLFSWVSFPDEESKPCYKVRLEKARDLSGKAVAGLELEGNTFSQFKALLKTSENQQGQTPQTEERKLSLGILRKALGDQLRIFGITTQAEAIPYCSAMLGKTLEDLENLNRQDIQNILLGMHQAAGQHANEAITA